MNPNAPQVLYIIRGLPGSGKSRLAAGLSEEKYGDGRGVVEADQYFTLPDNSYQWISNYLNSAHEWTRLEATRRLSVWKLPLVAVSNTFSRLWEFAPYIEIAKRAGAEYKVIEPTTEWAKDPAACAARNVHGVPESVIQKMLARWEIYEDTI